MDCAQPFETLVGLAGDLFRRYAPRCNVGTLDLLHIAAARRFGGCWFLSFDSDWLTASAGLPTAESISKS